ncbi:MAG: hypothetical protein QME47_08045, partial [Candidatus Thermoplasmatota archaeon]|nr:hypothetical protein [Candidatus Thermoplasmatota archaeon]
MKAKQVFANEIVPNLNRPRVIEFDEFYVNTSGGTGGILNAIDSETLLNFHSSLCMEVNTEKAEEVFKHLLDLGINPEIGITDDSKIYHSIWKYFGAKHPLCEFHLMRNIFKDSQKLKRTKSKKKRERLLKKIIKNCRIFFSQRRFGEKYNTTNNLERLERFQ